MQEIESVTMPSCLKKIRNITAVQIGLFVCSLREFPTSLEGQISSVETGLGLADRLEKQISDLCGLPSPLISCPVLFGKPCPQADSEYNVGLRKV